jgi:hypothetical protein
MAAEDRITRTKTTTIEPQLLVGRRGQLRATSLKPEGFAAALARNALPVKHFPH